MNKPTEDQETRSTIVCHVGVGGQKRKKINFSLSIPLSFCICISVFCIFLSYHLTSHLCFCVCVYDPISVVCFWIVFQSFNYSRKDSVWRSLSNMHTFQKHHTVHGMQTPGIEPIPLIRKWLPNVEMSASVKRSIPVYRASLVWSGLRRVCFLWTPKDKWQSSLQP